MIVAGIYSFNRGREIIEQQYAHELREVIEVITSVQSAEHKVKESKEKTMPGRLLYSPPALNVAFKQHFGGKGWVSHRVACDYPTQFYTAEYQPSLTSAGAFREVNFVKTVWVLKFNLVNMHLWSTTSVPR